MDISESESEPSRDNLEEEEIRKLFDFFNKRKIRKITKRKKFNSFLRNNNNNFFKKKHFSELKSKILEINKNQSIGFPKIEKNHSPTPTLNRAKKNLTINSTTTNNNNIKTAIINEETTSKFLYKNKKFKFNQIINNKFTIGIPSNINTVIKTYEDKETQTEEKFFMFHWTYFFGLYKIISPNLDQKKITLGSPILSPLLLKNEKIDFVKKSKLKSVGTMMPSSLNKIKISLNNNNHNTKKEKDKNIRYIYNSDFEKVKYLNSLIIKNDYRKIFINGNNRFNTNRINNLKNKMRNIKIENSRKKIVKSFISSFPIMKDDEYLKKYLNDENRINFL